MYYEVLLRRASGGFGMWDVIKCDEEWADEADLIEAIYQSPVYEEIYDLTKDMLPAHVEDIRGRVHNEPPRILALVTRQHDEPVVDYVGIEEKD
jgi:hypothetical protein